MDHRIVLNLSPEEACAEPMARALLAIARADGLDETEANLIAGCLYPEKEGTPEKWLARLGSLPPLAPEALAEAIPDTAHRDLFANLAECLAYSDGVVSAQERDAVELYCSAIGRSAEVLEKLERALYGGLGDHPLADAAPEAARLEAQQIYLQFLHERDGDLTHSAHVLPKREAYFENIERDVPLWPDPIDLPAFERCYESGHTDHNLDRLLLFLLVACKLNRAESYGANLAVSTGKIDRAGWESAHAYVNTEELYHTRILQNMVACFGIKLELQPPPPALRLITRSMVSLPKRMTIPVIFAAEIGAVTLFRLMIDKAEELLSAHPPVRDRVVELLSEILTDEVGHVAFCRSMLGQRGIRLTRVLMPLVINGVLTDFPEFDPLFGKGVVRQAIAQFDLPFIREGCSRTPFWFGAAPS